MPVKIKREFEREYGKKKGDRVFYAWQNKRKHYKKRYETLSKRSELVIRGNPRYVNRMYLHLNKEHPSVRGNIYRRPERRMKK